MHAHTVEANVKQNMDTVIEEIADYVMDYEVTSELALETAKNCLMDTLGCGVLALNYPACVKMLGPIVPNTVVPNGCHVPARKDVLDPLKAAFDIGCMVRWLDFNDTWLAAEWGHPSDNLGAILAVAEWMSNTGAKEFTMKDVLEAMIKAHEIQGCLALENSFNRVGLDHVLLVKIASTAVATKMLGGDKQQVMNALSQAFVDGQSLRTYRHAPNAGSRKSWAAGDATSRAVRLAMITMDGEMGYPSALTAPIWGFYDVLFKGKEFKFQRQYGTYVMENILFKISFPAEFHAQTAVEAAVMLHPEVKDRLDKIEKIVLTTHESAIRIISKDGELHNPADRDHCLQYMVAVGLLNGDLTADDYEDSAAKNPNIDLLRSKMEVIEDTRYSADYHDPEKRSIANAIQVFFKDGTSTNKEEVEYPIGHRLRREEGIPVLENKFICNLNTQFNHEKSNAIFDVCKNRKTLESYSVINFMAMW